MMPGFSRSLYLFVLFSLSSKVHFDVLLGFWFEYQIWVTINSIKVLEYGEACQLRSAESGEEVASNLVKGTNKHLSNNVDNLNSLSLTVVIPCLI